MLSDIAKKIADFFGESSDYGVDLDQEGVKSRASGFLKWESLGDLLPYKSYDPEYELFINNKSIGFIIEVSLFIGSDNKLENEFSGLFKSVLPPGSSIQFLLSALPKVDHIINYWSQKKGNNMVNSMLKHVEDKRSEYFRKISNAGQIRNLRGIISVSIPVTDKGPVVKEKISDLKEQIKSLFATRGGGVRSFAASDLINYLSDILNYDGTTYASVSEWNQLESINKQVIDRNRKFSLKEDGLGLDDNYEMRLLSVHRYPPAWSFGLMNNLLGDNFNDYLKIPCSFLIHFGLYIEDSKFKKTGMLAKATRVESQAGSPLGEWIPALKREAEEWGFVREQLEKSERLVKTHYQVVLIDKHNTIASSEQLAHSLYRANGWELSKDKFIVIPSLLSVLPLTWAEGVYDDMSYFKKLKTTLSHEAVNLLPLQGEFKGSNTPGMLLTGRRGQLCYWYPFDTDLGNSNYNVSVVGRSGAGKSVFMQELATSILRQGGKVYVLDVGRSFEKQSHQLGGQFIEFKSESELCLNPFSSIDASDKELVDDALATLKPIISQMVAPKAGTSDYEDSLIAKALSETWDKFGNDACISDVADWFIDKGQSEEAYKRIGEMLFPYSKAGVYGKYFNGKANIDFKSNFFVTELGELKTKKELQRVIVQIFMLLVTNQVILGPREQEAGLIFDEAWDLLKGKQGGEFIEMLARTLRKHRGSLIVGTQNLEDFYSSPGAKAAFMNSDWLCCLEQKPESISLLKESKKFAIDDHQQKLLESVKTRQGKYAEIMIMTGGSGSVCRLILDPFSRILYSTKSEEYKAVQSKVAEGMDLSAAVDFVAREVFRGEYDNE